MSDQSSTDLLLRYQRLIEIARDLASTLDLKSLLNRIVQAAADVCGAENASILLFDRQQGNLRFEAATNLDKPVMSGLVVPVDGSIAGWIVSQRQSIIINDVAQEKRHFDQVGQAIQVPTRSLLGVPMISKDDVVGALEAINKIEGDFDGTDQEILMTLGAQAAVAIENARLFQQSDLISEFVHELRTPLGSLNTAAHLLLHPTLDDARREQMVRVIHSETSRLAQMSTSFLDVARLESGRSPFKMNSYHLHELLQECADLMQTEAAQNGIEFISKISDAQCVQLGDYHKLKQAILNLLSNAIKYNQPGGKVILEASGSTEGCRVAVSDTGIGIPQQHIDNLFTKFYRVPGSEKHAPGTGLGLIIVKRIIEGHGGSIHVESATGKGTTFTIELPAQA